MTPLTLLLPDLEATRRLGQHLGETARRGDVLLLRGDLGAGKTSLAQGLAVGLGIEGAVTSPTFTLLNEYRGRLPLFHFDMYRLDAHEVASLSFADYWEEPRGVVAIEWPERLTGMLVPESYLAVTLTHEGAGRQATFTATGREGERWLKEVHARAARD